MSQHLCVPPWTTFPEAVIENRGMDSADGSDWVMNPPGIREGPQLHQHWGGSCSEENGTFVTSSRSQNLQNRCSMTVGLGRQ